MANDRGGAPIASTRSWSKQRGAPLDQFTEEDWEAWHKHLSSPPVPMRQISLEQARLEAFQAARRYDPEGFAALGREQLREGLPLPPGLFEDE